LNDNDLLADLKGNTLRVYWALLQAHDKSVGPRDIQRKLRFSSPNLSVYHLDKLVELGLAEKVSGEYHLRRTVDVGVLKQFTKLGRMIIPRHILYASMWTTLLAFLLIQTRDINFYSVFALLLGFLGAAILWFETYRSWRTRPN
jgi:DNA-binding MarR family transcriptional regulator